MKKHWKPVVLVVMSLLSWRVSANCQDESLESAQACAGKTKCVEVKVKHYCGDGGQLKKQYFIASSEETVEINDRSDDVVYIFGDFKWAFELTFYDAANIDVTQALKKSGNLSKDCERGHCRWQLAGGGLTQGQDSVTYKYTISKKAQIADNIDALDPSVIVKR